MKTWKKNAVAAAGLVAVCAGIYVNWLYTEDKSVVNITDTLDAEKNSCEIVMRRSNRNGKFINDTSIYTNNSEEAMKKLCYPIHISNEKQPFIRLNAPADSEIQSLLVDEKILEKIKKVSLSLSEFQKRCMELLMFYKREYLERLEDFYEVDSAEYTDAFNKLYNSFFNYRS